MRGRLPALLAAVAIAAAGAWIRAELERGGLTGGRLLRLPDDPQAGAHPLLERRVAGIELPRHGQVHLPWRRVRARFSGHLYLATPGLRELRLVTNGTARLRLDGREVLSRAQAAAAPAERIRLDLAAGSHALEVDYESPDGPHVLRVLMAEPGRAPQRLAPEQLFPEPPGPETLARVSRASVMRSSAAWLLALSLLSLAAVNARTPAGARAAASRAGALVWRAAPLLVVALAAVLRAEALVNRHWQEQAPLALRTLAVAMWDLHPPGLRLAPGPQVYEGDPFTYLRFAREMQGFYDAHVREPVFVATARGFIALVGGADVGLSLASAFYSTLLVAATYALGASFFSKGIGLLAALALALERQSVHFSALGWRDDAFAFFTVLALVAVWRLVDGPGFGRAVFAGLAAAAACLTRITALAYVVPACVYAVVLAQRAHGRRAHEPLAVGGVVLTAALSPYLLSCWIAFSDPLHAINAHTVFYRGRAGLPHDAPMNVARFLGYGRGPFELLDTALVGLTSYPFLNKWADFDDWIPGAAFVLPAATLLGLAGFALLPRGRLLLLALFASLVPYAVTWEVPGGAEWRFTLHAYPFYLVAAFWALSAAGRREDRPRLLRAMAFAALGLPAAWLSASGLHFLRVREELHAGKPAFVRPGLRDAFLFPRGWTWPRGTASGAMREASAGAASIRLPLSTGRAHRVTLRLRPAAGCREPCRVDLLFSGRSVARFVVEPREDGFGSYEATLESADAETGENLMVLEGGPVGLWYVRVEPVPPAYSQGRGGSVRSVRLLR